MISATASRIVFVISVYAVLSACAQSKPNLSSDFGRALRQDIASQIADPDPRYEGKPDPGSSGDRVGLAQKRYQANDVIKPTSQTASGRADNGASGGSGGGVGMAAGAR